MAEWLWKDGKEWVAFSHAQATKIEKAYQKGEEEVQATGKISVNFKKMKRFQGNKSQAVKREGPSSEDEEEESEEEAPKKRGRPAASKKKKAEESEESEEESEESEEESEEKPKRKKPTPKAKKGPAKRVAKKRKKAEMSSDVSESDEPPKKKRAGGKKGKPAPKKPAPKGKKGKKPLVELKYTPDPMLFEEGDDIELKGGKLRGWMEIWRAIFTKNADLLRKMAKNADVTCLNITYGGKRPLDYLLETRQFDLLQALACDKEKNLSQEGERFSSDPEGVSPYQYRARYNQYSGKRAKLSVGGTTSEVGLGRGGKEGNMAFDHVTNYECIDGLFESIWSRPEVAEEAIKFLQQNEKELGGSFEGMVTQESYLQKALECGNLKLARWIEGEMFRESASGYGLNDLHHKALEATKGEVKFDKILRASVTKKGPMRLTPLHFAAANPNISALKQLLSQCDMPSEVKDLSGRSPIHIAAACASPAPLKCIIESKLIDVKIYDRSNTTPLMLAATFGRIENIKVILAAIDLNNDKAYIQKRRAGMTALHFAVKNHRHAVVKELIKSGVATPNDWMQTTKEKKSPLMMAIENGDMEMMHLLIDLGANIKAMDRKKRNALVWAAKFGQAEALVFLLNQGLPPSSSDSSGNTALHYAAAFGWKTCCDWLVQAGADVGAKTQWNTTPLLIAITKERLDVVEYLISKAGNSSLKDAETSRKAILESLEKKETNPKSTLESLTRLLEWGFDATVVDLAGNTALHYITQSPTPLDLQFFDLFVNHGCKPPAPEEKKKNLIQMAIEYDNVLLLEHFLKQGLPPPAIPAAESDDGCNFLHRFAAAGHSKVSEEILALLKEHMQGGLKELAKERTREGFTPFEIAVASAIGAHPIVQLPSVAEGEGEAKREEPECEPFKDWSVRRTATASAGASGSANSEPVDTTTCSSVKLEGELPQFYFHKQEILARKKAFEEVTKKGEDDEGNDSNEEEDDAMDEGAEAKGASALDNGKDMSEDENEDDEEMDDENEDEDEDEEDESDCFDSEDDEDGPVKKKPIVCGGKRANKGSFAAKAKEAAGDEKLKLSFEEYISLWASALEVDPTAPFELTEKAVELVENGAKQAFSHTMTELFMIKFVKWNLLHMAAFVQNVKLAELMMGKFGCKADAQDSCGWTPLHIALNAHVPDLKLIEVLCGSVEDKRNLDGATRYGVTPLHMACHKGSHQVVELLLERGANPMAKSKRGSSTLHYATDSTVWKGLSFQILRMLLDKVPEKEWAGVLNSKDMNGRTPLHCAFVGVNQSVAYANVDPIEVVNTFVSVPGIDVNGADKFGVTPLHYATMATSSLCASTLIAKGANVNQKDRCQNTCLGIALQCSSSSFAATLINANADLTQGIFLTNYYNIGVHVDVELKEGEKEEDRNLDLQKAPESVFYCLLNNGWTGAAFLVLQKGGNFCASEDACRVGHWPTVLSLVCSGDVKSIIRPGTQGDGRSFWHALVMGGSGCTDDIVTEAARKLGKRMDQAQLRQTLNQVDNDGITPLTQAVARGYYKFVEFALISGAEIDMSQAPKDNQGKKGGKIGDEKLRGATPVTAAVLTGNKKILKLLLKTANPDRPDARGIPPIHLAVESGSWAMVAHFMQSKCNLNAPHPQHSNATPLLRAIVHNYMTIAALFLGDILPDGQPVEGGDPKVDVNAVDSNGRNVIHYVVEPHPMGTYHNIKLLELLHKKGANINLKDKAGKSPIFYAYSHKSGLTAEKLVELGGEIEKEGKMKAIHARMESVALSRDQFGGVDEDIDVDRDAQAFMASYDEVINASKEEAMKGWEVGVELVAQKFEHRQYSAVEQYGPKDAMIGVRVPKKKPAPKKKKKGQEAEEDDMQEDTEVSEGAAEGAEEDVKFYHCKMVKTDVSYGNDGINNFYLMQLLKDRKTDLYYVWTQWGMVGQTGQYQRTPFASREDAVTEFKKIFKAKSANSWDSVMKGEYERAQGKWKWIDPVLPKPPALEKMYMPSGILEKLSNLIPKAGDKEEEGAIKSNLPKAIQELMKQICDVNGIAYRLSNLDTLKEGYFAFGKLENSSIARGKELLQELIKVMKRLEAIKKDKGAVGLPGASGGDSDSDSDSEGEGEEKEKEEDGDDDGDDEGEGKGEAEASEDKKAEWIQLSERITEIKNEYFETLPQKVGWNGSVRNVLHNTRNVDSALLDINALQEVEVAQKILMGAAHRLTGPSPMHVWDYAYAALDITMQALPKDHSESQLLREYFHKSLGPMQWGGKKLQVIKVEKAGERARFNRLGNHHLLWHGSHRANYLSILSNGLKIAPPTAMQSGLAFGRGIYFADMASKSINYCRSDNGVAVMLVNEVALGKVKELNRTTSIEAAPAGFDSCRAPGQQGPHPGENFFTKAGPVIPFGRIVNYQSQHQEELTYLQNHGLLPKEDKLTPEQRKELKEALGEKSDQYVFHDSEYIVYKESQQRLRYILLVEEGGEDED